MRGGILDCRCARRSARRQVGTKGWSYSDRTKGWALELNSTALAHHAQFAELDAHNYTEQPGSQRTHRWRRESRANSSLNPNSLVTGQKYRDFHRRSLRIRLVARNPEPNPVTYDPIPYASEQGSYFGLARN